MQTLPDVFVIFLLKQFGIVDQAQLLCAQYVTRNVGQQIIRLGYGCTAGNLIWIPVSNPPWL